jgi:hypothetical protein
MKAFPQGELHFGGMELRDYFAAKAMPLAMKWVKHNYNEQLGDGWMWDEEEYENDAKEIAGIAYHIADAMMKARKND